MTRSKDVGDLGEDWTFRLLERARFRNIQDLNELRYNHPGADFLAERDGVRYFITVKARNKYRQGTRSLNSGYNIFPAKVRKFAKSYDAKPAWLTIQIDTNLRSYSAYFGTINSLRNPKAVAVPMTPGAVARYECLARDHFDNLIVPELSNQLMEITAMPLKEVSGRGFRRAEKSVPLSFDDYFNYTDEERRPLLARIRLQFRESDGLIEKITSRQRIAYSKRDRKVFLEVKVQRHAICLHLIDVPDPDDVLSPIPESHGWRQLTRRVKIETEFELERVLPLLRTARLRG